MVDKFKGLQSAFAKVRSELSNNNADKGRCVDFIVDFVDVSVLVDAFKNFAYPYAFGPACPQ